MEPTIESISFFFFKDEVVTLKALLLLLAQNSTNRKRSQSVPDAQFPSTRTFKFPGTGVQLLPLVIVQLHVQNIFFVMESVFL